MKPSIKNNMENLPVEVLEIVFQPLSKKEDIENCFNVNSKWRHIIENMFSNKSMYSIFFWFELISTVILKFTLHWILEKSTHPSWLVFWHWSNIFFLVNNFSDWIFIFNIGRDSKMLQFLYNMAKYHWKPIWNQLYVFMIYTIKHLSMICQEKNWFKFFFTDM